MVHIETLVVTEPAFGGIEIWSGSSISNFKTEKEKLLKLCWKS